MYGEALLSHQNIRSFAETIPDEQNWLLQVAARLQVDNLHDLLEALTSYKGRPQHLACWMCFAGQIDLASSSVCVATWKNQLLDFRNEFGWTPNPMRLLSGQLYPKSPAWRPAASRVEIVF